MRTYNSELKNAKIYPTMTCVKSVRIRSYFCPHFPAFGYFPHTPYLSVFSPNAGKCGPE